MRVWGFRVLGLGFRVWVFRVFWLKGFGALRFGILVKERLLCKPKLKRSNSSYAGDTADDINPALPLIRNIP